MKKTIKKALKTNENCSHETLSFGKGQNNMFDILSENSRKLTWEITNPHPDERRLIISSQLNISVSGNGSTTEKLNSSDISHLSEKKVNIKSLGTFNTPKLIDTEPNLWYLGVESKDSRQTVTGFYDTITLNPTQITKLRMTSTNISEGNPNPANYNYPVEHIWMSPYTLPKVTPFSLRVTQDNKINALQYAEVDFIANGFNALVSSEDLLVLTIAGGTKLNVEIFIGAEMSAAQQFYRLVKKGCQPLQPIAKSMEKARLESLKDC